MNSKWFIFSFIVLNVITNTDISSIHVKRVIDKVHLGLLGRCNCHYDRLEVRPSHSILYHCHWWHSACCLNRMEGNSFPLKARVAYSSLTLIQSTGIHSREMNDSWVPCSSVSGVETGTQLWIFDSPCQGDLFLSLLHERKTWNKCLPRLLWWNFQHKIEKSWKRLL